MAIASNVVFMAYGLTGRIYPVFVLHAVLLPLNLLRLRQVRTLIRRVREASRGDLSMEWLLPLMTRQRLEAGQVLLPREAPWLASYIGELLAFPHGSHDDQVDSTSQALNWLSQRLASYGERPRPNPALVQLLYQVIAKKTGRTGHENAGHLTFRVTPVTCLARETYP